MYRNDRKPTEMTDFSALLYTSASEIYTLSYTLSLKKVIPFSYGAIKGSILQGHIQDHIQDHIQGQYSWVLHATETEFSSALVLLHHYLPYLKISIVLNKPDVISTLIFPSKKKQNDLLFLNATVVANFPLDIFIYQLIERVLKDHLNSD